MDDEDTRVQRIHERRGKELQRLAERRVAALPARVWSSVVGVKFAPGYPETLHELETQWLLEGQEDEGLPAVLVRVPDNPVDANAIEVHSPTLGQRIGHLPAALAARLAPLLDAGETWQGEFTGVRVSDEHINHPGIDVVLHRVEEST